MHSCVCVIATYKNLRLEIIIIIIITYYYTIRMSLVTGLFFLVLLLNQR